MRTRDLAIAIGLMRGLSAEAACLGAGYSRTTARKDAWRIVRRPGVRQALLDLGLELVREYSPRLASQLEDPNIDLGFLIQVLRFVVDELGAADALQDRVNPGEPKIPETVRELIAKRVQELLGDKKSAQ